MHQKFNSEKAIEAAAVIARHEGKRTTRLRLLKLLYIADRTLLKERGRPLLGSRTVAMDNGPLHSDVYDMLKGEHIATPRWSKYFTNEGPRDVLLTQEPDTANLSRNEIETLQRVVDLHSQIDDWQLSELTHGFEEWKAAYEKGTSKPIELEAIIEGTGRGADREAIMKDLANDAAFDRFFERTLQ